MVAVGETDPALDAYRRYGPALVRKAERMLENHADAGDVVQALFVELVEGGGARRAPLDLPYLYRAVTNRCLNLIRDRRTRARLVDRQEPALRGPVRLRCDDAVVGLDLMVKLAEALDDDHMEILVCRYVDDMTQEEIASVTRASRKTIGRRLQRIREEVRRLRDEAPARAGGGDPGGSRR